MNRSLDFTACNLPCKNPCWRRLTKEEIEWLEKTPKMTQKNYEAIKIYNQKEKIFELKGQIQTLKQQLKVATEDLYVIASNANPDFNRMEYAEKSLKVIKELEK